MSEEEVNKIIEVYDEVIADLKKENQKLKNRITELENDKQALIDWLNETLNELKQNDIYDRTSYETGQIIATECIIAKIEGYGKEEVENDKF